MREIKFRAWDANEKEMYANALPIFSPGIAEVETVKNGMPAMQTIHGVVLMQFTGLLDKNGKEIYEGDIVQTNHVLKGHIEWNKMASQWWVRLKHDRNVYRELVANSGGGKGGKLFCDWLEVIGNIYENPELLNP